MITLFLVLTATFFNEAGTSVGKFKVKQEQEGLFTMGFLNIFWTCIFFILIALFIKGSFVLNLASWPTVSIRIVLEIVQAHFTILAINKADRSTFNFIRIVTLPLLLITDLILGYSLSAWQITGIILIILALTLTFFSGKINKKGAWLVLITAINAVIIMSLYKYNITNFNSVTAEQSIVSFVIMLYFYLMSFKYSKENPLNFLTKPVFFLQSFMMGLASLLVSFSYTFAIASVVTTYKRSLSTLWSMLSGKLYFKEKYFSYKLIIFLVIVSGLIFLTQ